VDWGSFHGAWINTLFRQLNNRQLPSRYRAVPQVHFGTEVEVALAAVELEARPPTQPTGAGNGAAVAVWAPSRPAQTFSVDFAAHDVFELRVEDRHRGRRLVAAVELVSPRNKDRASARRDFAIKIASYLQQQVSVVVVDVVTAHHKDLYSEFLSHVGLPPMAEEWAGSPPLYAVACRTNKVEKQWQLDAWPEALTLGAPLPVMPLWLAGDLAISLQLEASYEETLRDFRLDS
jgi:hypothetical protein